MRYVVSVTSEELRLAAVEERIDAELALGRQLALVSEAEHSGRALVADVGLTDENRSPRCARVDPPAVRWSVAEE